MARGEFRCASAVFKRNVEAANQRAALAGIEQLYLAREAGLPPNDIVEFETPGRTPPPNNLAAIRAALEAAGVILIDDDDDSDGGVRA